MRILLGGSPCTHWSIAQKNNRETEAEGIGWELFKNYLIAKEKFKPDYFLYENNKSAAQPIKDQISKELGVPLQYINSSLLSAQNRQRFYAHNIPNVPQPEDRGILLKDVLDSAVAWQEKAYALTTRCSGAIPEDTLSRHRHTMVAEPINTTVDGKSQAIRATCYKDGIRNLVGNEVDKRTAVAEPVRVGDIGNGGQGNRLYSVDGKAVSQTASSGGIGSNTGLYAMPVCVQEQVRGRKANADGSYTRIYEARIDGKSGTLTETNRQNAIAMPVNVGESKTVQKAIPDIVNKLGFIPEMFNAYNRAEIIDKSPTLSTGSMVTSSCATCKFEKTEKPVYEVKDGLITIKDKQYPIKLADGYYIIRKLTVSECRRLQTVPDWYIMPCSNSQNYKMLGNGWTVEVIKHILSHIPDIKNEPIEVLSMYDGMSCGQITLTELGCNITKYYASEIDKYAIQTTMANFPDTIQLGDAFDVRTDKWVL